MKYLRLALRMFPVTILFLMSPIFWSLGDDGVWKELRAMCSPDWEY